MAVRCCSPSALRGRCSHRSRPSAGLHEIPLQVRLAVDVDLFHRHGGGQAHELVVGVENSSVVIMVIPRWLIIRAAPDSAIYEFCRAIAPVAATAPRFGLQIKAGGARAG